MGSVVVLLLQIIFSHINFGVSCVINLRFSSFLLFIRE